MDLWPFNKLKKRQENDGFIVKDGQIIVKNDKSEEPNDTEQPLEEVAPPELTPVEPVIEPEIPEAPAEFVVPEKTEEQFKGPHLPATINYSPSCLTDVEDGGDMGLYHRFLHMQGYKKRTCQEYLLDIRMWRSKLAGKFPDSAMINSIVNDLKSHRGHRLITVLKSYGRYRCIHGDCRVITIFNSSQNISYPKKTVSQKREILTKEQLQLYRNSARDLCGDMNRAGIWMGLLIFRISSSEICDVEIRDGKLNVSGRVIDVPLWLSSAITGIEKKRWALGRNAVRKGLAKYGVTPYVLYMSACNFHGTPHNGRRADDAW